MNIYLEADGNIYVSGQACVVIRNAEKVFQSIYDESASYKSIF